MARVKGTAIAGRLRYVRRHHGEEGLGAVLAALPDRALARELELGVLRSSWYPLGHSLALTETIDRLFGSGDGALAGPLAAQVAEDDLSTVYKIFFKLASPAYTIEKAMEVWRQYHDSGRLQVVERGPGLVVAHLVDFEAPHAAVCASTVGWVERFMHLAGAEDVRVTHPSCLAAGGERCEFVLRWT